MTRTVATLLVVALIVAAACGSTAGPAGTARPPATAAGGAIGLAIAQEPRASGSPQDAAGAARAIDAFGLDLYRAMAGGRGNVVLSPASVALALGMARAGARGETAAQMDRVLSGFGSEAQAGGASELEQALSGLSGSFADAEGHELSVTLRIANAPFAQATVHWSPAFLDALAVRFGAGVQLVDYERDPEAARLLINGWVRDRTEGRIRELIAGGVLDQLTRLVLVNAIYLRAPWLTPFEDGQTAAAPFTRADGSTVSAQLMSLHAEMPYAKGTGWQAVELPYVGGRLAMTVIVPDDLTAFEKGLSADAFTRIAAALAPTQVTLAFPRFGIDTQAGLAPTLAGLGMPLAFDPDRADFSGMTDTERLFVSAVIHQATIDVDEKGTEAAAATAVVLRATGAFAEPVTLTVDRPFLFALRDTRTGAILFLGRVADPTSRT